MLIRLTPNATSPIFIGLGRASGHFRGEGKKMTISLKTELTPDGVLCTDEFGNQAGLIRPRGDDGFWRAEAWTERKAFHALEAAEYWVLAMHIERQRSMEG